MTCDTIMIFNSHYKETEFRYCSGLTHNTFGVIKSGISISVLSTFLLGCNIFLTALSAFRLQSYQQLNMITAEQVGVFETAVIGVSGPFLVLSAYTDLCFDQITLLFLLAIPQVSVLLLPFLLEYIQVWLSRYNWNWKTNDRSKEKAEPWQWSCEVGRTRAM